MTRKRWANGVDGKVFFEKNLPDSAPDWVRHHTIAHKEHDTEYPIVDDLPTLVWMAQQAALELHVPQWRFGPRGGQQPPDRLVLDLDPGEGVGLPECVEVALAAREILHGMGLDPYPVTSGSKGIHLYAALDGGASTAQVSDVAHELAKALEQDLPDLVLSSMSRAERTGKVFVDWSQNNGNKTTIAPYSLRGRDRPTVAAPADVGRARRARARAAHHGRGAGPTGGARRPPAPGRVRLAVGREARLRSLGQRPDPACERRGAAGPRPAHGLPREARRLAHPGTGARGRSDGAGGRHPDVRHPGAPRDAGPLRLPPRARRRARELGAAEG